LKYRALHDTCIVFTLSGILYWCVPSCAWAGNPYLRANTLVCVTPQAVLVHYDCPKLRALAREFKVPFLAQQEDCPDMEQYVCINTKMKTTIQVIGEPTPYVTLTAPETPRSQPLKIKQPLNITKVRITSWSDTSEFYVRDDQIHQ
jgi:hypothetical protein